MSIGAGVVQVLRANQCRLGMRISVGTNANTPCVRLHRDF
jgi:hypothetical protein